MDQIFSNREISISIWFLVFLSWALMKSDVRDAFKQVLLVFCNVNILIFLGLMGGYVYLIIEFLSDFGLWSIEQLKNTIMWFVFVASVELFKANTVYEQEGYFKKSLRGHFKLLVVLEFIVAFHSFSLVAELVIVPLTTLVAILLAYSELKEENEQVKIIMSLILSTFGIFMVCYSIYYISLNFDSFSKTKTLMDFIIPIMLSISLLPFIFLTSIYILYENILVRVNVYTDKKSYRIYAKIKGIIYFNKNYKSLDDWLAYSCVSDFKSIEAIKKSIINHEANKV